MASHGHAVALMSRREIVVEGAHAGATLAGVLRELVPELSWSRARSLIERGKVTVDDELVTDAARRLTAGQRLVLDESARVVKAAPRARIVWEDAHVVVIDKPSGVSSVP